MWVGTRVLNIYVHTTRREIIQSKQKFDQDIYYTRSKSFSLADENVSAVLSSSCFYCYRTAQSAKNGQAAVRMYLAVLHRKEYGSA